jgi:hypothetical protein
MACAKTAASSGVARRPLPLLAHPGAVVLGRRGLAFSLSCGMPAPRQLSSDEVLRISCRRALKRKPAEAGCKTVRHRREGVMVRLRCRSEVYDRSFLKIKTQVLFLSSG